MGECSPVETFTPLVGAEIKLDAGASFTLDRAPGFDYGSLVDAALPTISGTPVAANELAYLGMDRSSDELVAGPESVRLLCIGGEPLNKSMVLWWNFVGRSHEETVAFRAA